MLWIVSGLGLISLVLYIFDTIQVIWIGSMLFKDLLAVVLITAPLLALFLSVVTKKKMLIMVSLLNIFVIACVMMHRGLTPIVYHHAVWTNVKVLKKDINCNRHLVVTQSKDIGALKVPNRTIELLMVSERSGIIIGNPYDTRNFLGTHWKKIN